MTDFRKTITTLERINNRTNCMLEDWGSSDDSYVVQQLDKYLDEKGLSPETIMQGAMNLAEFYAEPMGYEGDWTAAAHAIKDSWLRKSERGQALSRMFAPRESIGEEQNHSDAEYELFVETDADGDTYVVLSANAQEIATMDADVWEELCRVYKRAQRQRDFERRA